MFADRLARFISRRSARTIVSGGVLLILLVGAVDYLTGPEPSLEGFYYLPILIVALFAGWRAGVLTVAVAAAIVLLSDRQYFAQPALPFSHYWNDAMSLAVFLFVARLGATLKNALEREQALARTDYVTGAANRRAFFEAAEQEINRARRYHRPFAAAYVDLDNFKPMNDQFGHDAGDAVLRAVVAAIRRAVRVNDLAARLGGDEFIVLLPETEPEAARGVLERVQARLAETMRQSGWPVTFSIGLAAFVTPPASVEALIRQADELMYAAKSAGKNMLRQSIIGQDSEMAARSR